MSNPLALVAGLVLIGGMMTASLVITTHVEDATITVQSKERLLQVTSTKEGGTSSNYRNFVYTTDETYTVADSFWNGHFTSSTVYARLTEGSTCRVRLAGYRFGFLSMFQNIISAECDR